MGEKFEMPGIRMLSEPDGDFGDDMETHLLVGDEDIERASRSLKAMSHFLNNSVATGSSAEAVFK